MLEKCGNILLTEEDMDMYNAGIVSDRIQNLWGFSLDDLRNAIENKQFVMIKDIE